jgi:hypothetical protein
VDKLHVERDKRKGLQMSGSLHNSARILTLWQGWGQGREQGFRLRGSMSHQVALAFKDLKSTLSAIIFLLVICASLQLAKLFIFNKSCIHLGQGLFNFINV